MFERKEPLSEAVDALWQQFGWLDRGSLITWERIESVIGCSRKEHPGKYIVHLFRRKLLDERDVACRPESGVGLRLLTCHEQVHWCAKNRQRRAYKQLHRGIKEVAAAPVDGLSDHDRLVKVRSVEGLLAQRKAARKALKQIKEAAKTEAIPVRRLPAIAQAQH